MHRNNNTQVNLLRLSNILGSAGALACALALTGCYGAPSVAGQGAGIDKRDGTLLGADLESANGTYGGGCTNRTGAWSVEIEVGAVLDNDPLSVLLNNDACVLTLTELVTTDGVLAADPTFALTASYQNAPSAFDDPIAFYANAKLDSVSFASDFVLTILYADDPDLATDDNTATFDVVESSAAGDSVSVPDYSIDPDALVIVADADQVVVSATGSVGLTAGSVTGETYVVVDAVNLDTYAELDAAYLGDTPAALGASIPAAKFTLTGEDLDTATKRTLIIARTESGVSSYQAFEITFHPATII